MSWRFPDDAIVAADNSTSAVVTRGSGQRPHCRSDVCPSIQLCTHRHTDTQTHTRNKQTIQTHSTMKGNDLETIEHRINVKQFDVKTGKQHMLHDGGAKRPHCCHTGAAPRSVPFRKHSRHFSRPQLKPRVLVDYIYTKTPSESLHAPHSTHKCRRQNADNFNKIFLKVF